ncbi:MAG: D-2-hydroxyacid dehydrogenase [Desulfovibrio sp.]|jgi:phosphoglycerate dehydrogenase-like enzyme|nr:D-2-hydroxyacid dehydrogenase [Desulfovibrio sp.]
MIVSIIHWKNKFIPALEKLLGEKICECHDKQEALKVLPEADILLTFGVGGGEYSIPMDEEILSACKKLRLVLSLSAGIETLPLQALLSKGIRICNTRGAHGGSIAEYVLCWILIISHHFHTFIRRQERCEWKTILYGEDIEGKTLCVIGVGSIGQEIGKKAKALNMRVTGTKRHPEPVQGFDKVLGTGHLHELLGEADYVVLSTPLTRETHHLMGAEEFQKMKDTAVFINVSRGNTVDESALIQALEEKQIAGAILDVFQIEPLPASSPLWKMENVLITPHNAGPTKNTKNKTIQLLFENIVRFTNGKALINEIKEI